LNEEQLLRIFLQSADSALRQSQAYFSSQGVRLEITEAAARRVAREAARQHRLGARALKEVFRRVIRNQEYEPHTGATSDGRVLIDVPQVEQAMATYRSRSDSATGSSGWAAGAGPPSGV
jgi:ATP-dependent protease Clp ATPase subunit